LAGRLAIDLNLIDLIGRSLRSLRPIFIRA
jgi:hypothetical protein